MDRVRKIANDFFREQGIKKLPIELDTVIDILKQRGWDVHLYSESEEFIRRKRLEEIRYTKNAFAVDDEDVKVIFYDDKLSVLDKLDALCHELGHIVLGHTNYGVIGKSKAHTDEIQEREADAFSLEFQAPAYKLYVDKIDSIEKIVSAGILSRENAEIQYRDSYLKYLVGQYPHPENIYCGNVHTTRWKKMLSFIPLGCSVIVLSFSFGYSGWLIGRSGQSTNNTPVIAQTTQAAPIVTTSPTDEVISSADLISVKSSNYDRSMTVYRTKTGKKYHKGSCRHLVGRTGVKTLSIEIAIAAGLESCDDCFN